MHWCIILPDCAEAQHGGHDGHHAASRSVCLSPTKFTASTGKSDQVTFALYQVPSHIEHDPHRLRSVFQICVASSRSVAITFKTEHKARLMVSVAVISEPTATCLPLHLRRAATSAVT